MPTTLEIVSAAPIGQPLFDLATNDMLVTFERRTADDTAVILSNRTNVLHLIHTLPDFGVDPDGTPTAPPEGWFEMDDEAKAAIELLRNKITAILALQTEPKQLEKYVNGQRVRYLKRRTAEIEQQRADAERAAGSAADAPKPRRGNRRARKRATAD